MKTWGMIGTVAFLLCLAGCSLYRNDRQYIWDSEYQVIRDLYDNCGSVAVVEQVLRDKRWTRAQINEVRYRLAQDYSLDEKGVPRGIDRPRAIVPAKQALAIQAGRPIGAPKRPLSSY
jgi:hypothetical protein